LKKEIVALFIVAINIAGFIYGFIHYSKQVVDFPEYLWLFILDCPLAVLFAAWVFLMFIFKQGSQVLTALASFGCIKYGIWTVGVLLFFSPRYLSPELFFASFSLILMHLLMIVEGAFLRVDNLKRYAILIALAFFLFNDVLDYVVLETHPNLIDETPEKISILAVLTFILTFIIAAFMFRGYRFRWPGILGEIRETLTSFLKQK